MLELELMDVASPFIALCVPIAAKQHVVSERRVEVVIAGSVRRVCQVRAPVVAFEQIGAVWQVKVVPEACVVGVVY